MKKTTFFFILILLFPLLLMSCNSSNRFNIDTNENRVVVKIKRFDKALISLDTTKIAKGVNQLQTEFPAFLPIYTSEILGVPATDTATIRNLFTKFLSNKTFAPVNKKAMETFGDVSDIENDISNAYTYIHHYFPDAKLPEIYFFVSGFNRTVIMNEQFIAVGTDFYLGADYPSYKDIMYEYMMYNARRECVATDIVSATLFRMFIMNSSEDRLLDNMIYRGKIMYLLSVFMPNEEPEDLMGYTHEQWEWSKKFEKEIWGSIIDQKDLFSTDVLLIKKYMNDAPFTSPVSQKSPGRLGTWVGWQIVDSYMKNNKDVRLRDLMSDNAYQKILEKSGYRP